MEKSDNTRATKFLTLVILIEVALLACACRGTSAPSFYYNESYYYICGSGESPILKECGLPLEITSDLAGKFISYLEPGSDNTYLFTETDTGTILYEYGPDPNENVYIVLLDRRYFAAIRCDADGYHGLQTEGECRPDKQYDDAGKNDTTPTSDSKFYIERTPEPETYPPVTIVPGFILDEPDDVE